MNQETLSKLVDDLQGTDELLRRTLVVLKVTSSAQIESLTVEMVCEVTDAQREVATTDEVAAVSPDVIQGLRNFIEKHLRNKSQSFLGEGKLTEAYSMSVLADRIRRVRVEKT